MGKVIKFGMIKDALTSLVNGLGLVGQDKAASTSYVLPLWTDDQLSIMYRSSWLAKKITNIPALDAFRNWRNWQAEDADITKIEEEEKRLDLKRKLMEVRIKARLFGGAALYMSTGESDVSVPLDPKRIQQGGLKFVNVMPRRFLNAGSLVNDTESEYFGKPEYYELANSGGNVRIHPSRLVIFKGEMLPDEELGAATVTGWGDSVLLSTLEAVKNVDATAANIASLVFEAKVDIIKIPDLMASLNDPAYEKELLRRFSLANVAKGNNSVLLLDGEEEHESKATSFQTLPDILREFMVLVSGAADIPMTRLLGQSPAGLSSTGESDLRNYYDRVKSMQTLEIDPDTRILNECLIGSALGSRPADIYYEWASLWQTTDKERAEIGKLNVEIITGLYNTNLYPPEALAKSGANMLTENSVMPGLIDEIEEAGGLPDYEMEAEEEANLERERIAAAANQNTQSRRAVGDAAPGPRTLYVRRDVTNATAIKAHYEAQGVDTMPAEKMHVTLIHSTTPVDWFKTGEPWDSELKLPAGGPRANAMFGPPGLEDSLVLMIASRELNWRHEAFKAAGAVSTYDEYRPHVSLRYNKTMTDEELAALTPYTGEIVLGPEIYEEVKA